MTTVSVQSKQENQTLPPQGLLDWLHASGLPLRITGESLKFFRSGLPVARCTADEETFDRLQSEIQRTTIAADEARVAAAPADLPQIRAAHASHQEIKLLLELPGWSEDFHCLIFRGHGFRDNGISFTIDRLIFRDADRGWEIDPELSDTLSPGERDALENECLADLDAERLRVVSNDPNADAFEQRLSAAEIVRLAVLPASLDFELDPRLKERLAADFDRAEAEQLSRKFLHRQFKKLLCGARPSRSFLLMSDIGVLDWFLPELAAGRDLAQNRYHKHDIFYHSIYTCDAVVGPNLPLRMAALFHDLGKVDTRRELPNGEATFHNHEMVSTRHTERILRRFGFAPDVAKHVRFLVRNHMFHYTDEWSDKAVRRFVHRVPPAMLADMITLRLADRKGSGKKTALPRAIKDLIRHMERIRAEEAELKVRDLAVDGHTLMELGMRPGPAMGDVLQQLLDEVKGELLPNEAEPLQKRAGEVILIQARTGTHP